MHLFGTIFVYFTDGGTGIFTDASLTRPALSKLKPDDNIGPDVDFIWEILERGKVKKLDAIFVAHSHFHITHPSGSIMILASPDYIPGKLDGLKTDICYLGIGAMGSKDEEFRHKY
jgi:L-ascorbate metabolism protein UlaG (beta-lactamase superfamily)